MPVEDENNSKLARNLTYQPFVLAAAVIALVVKIALSLALQSPVLDWVLVVILLVFIVAIGVYVWEYRKPRQPAKEAVKITTGRVEHSQITGIDSEEEPPGEESVTIKAKDVKKSKITGVKRRIG